MLKPTCVERLRLPARKLEDNAVLNTDKCCTSETTASDMRTVWPRQPSWSFRASHSGRFTQFRPFLVDLARIREECFGKKGPASTFVEISALAHPDWMIEVEAIAVL